MRRRAPAGRGGAGRQRRAGPQPHAGLRRSPAVPVSGVRNVCTFRPLRTPFGFQGRCCSLSEAEPLRATPAVPRGSRFSARMVNSAPQSRLLPFIFDLLISAVGTVQQEVTHFSLAVDLLHYLEYKPRRGKRLSQCSAAFPEGLVGWVGFFFSVAQHSVWRTARTNSAHTWALLSNQNAVS